MSDTVVIILITLVAILLVGMVVVLLLLLKGRKGVSSEQTGDLKARLEMMDKQTEKTIQLAVSEGMNKLTTVSDIKITSDNIIS